MTSQTHGRVLIDQDITSQSLILKSMLDKGVVVTVHEMSTWCNSPTKIISLLSQSYPIKKEWTKKVNRKGEVKYFKTYRKDCYV